MRLVVVSNRVESPKGAPAAGGLAVAVVEALRDHAGLWLGWSGRTKPRDPGLKPHLEKAEGFSIATIDLPSHDYELFYNGFANHCLWPLVHFRIDLVEYVRAEYEAYQKVNRRFADALLPLLEPDDVIWIHDYHFFLLPAELRARGVQQPIGFFLHTPFPPCEILSTMPRHRDLVRSLFDCDLVGLQTQADVDRFRGYVMQELRAEQRGPDLKLGSRSLHVEAFPVGIDAQRFHEFAFSSAGEREWARIRDMLRGRAQIIGVDRLDYSKGLLRRLHAYEVLLEQHPDTHGAVEYLQVAPVSRGDIKAYRDFRRELELKAARVNGDYGRVDWTPVRYLNRAVPRKALASFHRASRIGLVTPMRDGQNLVAKEYVAAQDPADPGVLVLSQFAGAAHELTEALVVNPFDPDGIADAMHLALTMPPEERKERHHVLREKVFRTTAQLFARRFVEALAPRTLARAAA